MKLWRLGLRLMIGGSVLCVVGITLIVVRGYTPLYLIFPIGGVALLVAGFLWPDPKETNRDGEENKPGVW